MSNEINDRIRIIRKRKGLKSKEAAKCLGLGEPGYSKLELHGNFSINQIRKIALFLGVSESFILNGEESDAGRITLADITTEHPKSSKIEPFTTTHKEQELIKALREISSQSGSSDYFNNILTKVKEKRDTKKHNDK